MNEETSKRKRSTYFYGIKEFWNKFANGYETDFLYGGREGLGLFICVSVDENYFALQNDLHITEL